ncbi:MAG: GNAT family N-acetyltransferase [Cyanobacteriota bacterium]|nr:GNAT family N-acetyltransferase [Cyanobacteriota bacterium]
MSQLLSQERGRVVIRPLQYRDLETIEKWCEETPPAKVQGPDPTFNLSPIDVVQKLPQIRRWYWLLKFLSWFPNPCQYLLNSYIAELDSEVKGVIQVKPVNRTRSSWRVERVVTELGKTTSIGSQLLRQCFEAIWEARTWLLEVNVNDKDTLALYRQNGFQPLANNTYWAIAPEQLQELALSGSDLPNLLPVSNADAQLLYQLDTASMPPQVRQVFDRHIQDFKSSFLTALVEGFRQSMDRTEVVSGYVFEPQRKAAIGYFQLQLSKDGEKNHKALLTVHPAYTWLYPELLAQMARMTGDFPAQSLQLASADYQPEREAYLEQVGAERVEHTLLMSRSVWHKLRESKSVISELQLSEVLQGFQPARKPIPSRTSWLRFEQHKEQGDRLPGSENSNSNSENVLPNHNSPDGGGEEE